MRASTTKTSIATLVAICALGVGAQALAPASAGAVADQQTGPCLAFRIVDSPNLFQWLTSAREACNPTSEDWRRISESGIGDRYNVSYPPDANLPGHYPGLDLPDDRAQKVQQLEFGPLGKAAGAVGRTVRGWLRGGEKAPVSKGARPKTTLPKASPAECFKMAKEILFRHSMYLSTQANAERFAAAKELDPARTLRLLSNDHLAKRTAAELQYTARRCGPLPQLT